MPGRNSADIAVLMAHYRCEKYLAQAVVSILGQHEVSLALYFVDDASPSESWKAVLAPYRTDPRLRVFQTERHVGLFRILNWLCGRVREPYIAFQDADDYSDLSRLRVQLDEMEGSGADIVGTSFVRIAENGETLSRDRMPEDASASLAGGNPFSIMHPTMMLRRSVLERLGGFDGRALAVAADTEFQLRSSFACKIRNVDRPLYFYRQWPGSMTASADTGKDSPARAAYAKAIYRAHRSRLRKARLGELLHLPWLKRTGLRNIPNDVNFEVRSNPIRVRCYDNWYDFDDAIKYLTPGGSGVWDGVAFVRENDPAPDWIGIFNHAGPEPLRIAASPNRVFFAIGEPPGRPHRLMHQGQGRGTFVLTSDEEVVRDRRLRRSLFLCPSMVRTWHVQRGIDELRISRVEEKPLRLSWITSNQTWLPGHRYRMDFLERLRRRVPFDLFGRGFHPIDDKWDALAPYRYSIAFESARAPYYFTEKVMDCFVAETMPIYFGSPSLGKFFPPESFVVLDPENPQMEDEIAAIIQSDLWLQRRDAILEAKRLVLEEYNIFALLSRFVKEHAEAPRPPVRMKIKYVPVRVPRS